MLIELLLRCFCRNWLALLLAQRKRHGSRQDWAATQSWSLAPPDKCGLHRIHQHIKDQTAVAPLHVAALLHCQPSANHLYISMHTSILASLPTSTHIYTEISTYTMISAVCIFAKSHNKMLLKIVESRTWRCFSATATAAPKCTRIGLPPCLASIAGAQTRAKCLSRRHIYIHITYI